MNQRALIVTTSLFFLFALLFLLIFSGARPFPSNLWSSFKFLYIIGLHYIALWALFTRFLGTQRGDAALVNILLVMCVTLFIVISAEFTLRFAFRDVTTTADNLSYFSSKWRKSVHLNRWGFRERDFDPIKPNDTYRIAVVGDSLAYGQGIDEKERFSNLLEKKLNRGSSRKYQVLNFALPGAETTDEIKFLTNSVLSNKPDFILLEWFINDVQGDDKQDAPHPVSFIPQKLRRNSVLFYLLHREISKAQRWLGLVTSADQYMSDRFGDPGSPASVKAAEMMNTFVKICREANIPVGLVLFSESYYDPATKLEFLLDRMLDYCKDQGLRCVDTRDVLLPMQGDPTLLASKFDPHPSAVVNRLVADQLLEEYRDIWSR